MLGCSGGELRGHRTTCFLVDGRLAVDAGALTAGLTLAELRRVDHVVLTHGHFDHVKGVPMAADLLVGLRDRALDVHATPATVRTLRDHVFNGELWPDFTRLPTRRRPVLRLRTFAPGRSFRAGRHRVRSVPVAHAVEAVGFLVDDGRVAVGISGDTGPTAAFWARAEAEPRLRALLVEVSFPDALQRVADLSGHLTPRGLAAELAKVKRTGVPVYLYHLKPAHLAELRRDLRRHRLHDVHVLATGDELRF